MRAPIRVLALCLLPLAAPAAGDALPRLDATLEGHALLAARTFIDAPRDAPIDTRVSGKFSGSGNLRNDAVGSQPASTAPPPAGRTTGLSLPFAGQPVQGVSSLAAIGDGSYWALADNGFGNKRNSPDAYLAIHRLRPDFARGTVHREATVFLRDPRKRIGFRIVHEGSRQRYLTGADLDPESIQAIAGGFWIGDEFGPFLIEFNAQGEVLRLVETMLDGRPLRGPDHPALQLGAVPGERVPFRVQRSGGFESLAASADGRHLYALLEKPLFGPDGAPEGRFLRLLEFDLGRGAWSGNTLRYALSAGATAVGEMNLIDAQRAVLIERDDGEGDASLACAAGQAPPACFATPARQRRIVLVDLQQPAADGSLRKLASIDLLEIADPNAVARQLGDRGASARAGFGMPFATIESVLRIDAMRLLVVNDNNLPFSAGRFLRRADDTEFVLLRVPGLDSTVAAPQAAADLP